MNFRPTCKHQGPWGILVPLKRRVILQMATIIILAPEILRGLCGRLSSPGSLSGPKGKAIKRKGPAFLVAWLHTGLIEPAPSPAVSWLSLAFSFPFLRCRLRRSPWPGRQGSQSELLYRLPIWGSAYIRCKPLCKTPGILANCKSITATLADCSQGDATVDKFQQHMLFTTAMSIFAATTTLLALPFVLVALMLLASINLFRSSSNAVKRACKSNYLQRV